MNEPIKVLYVNGNIMKRGGIEAFMMSYFRHFDKEKVHIDFIVHGYEKGVYDDEILAAGSKIYHVPTKSKNPFKYKKEIQKILRIGEYNIIHSHLDAMSCWVLKIAKESGIPVRIAHSHNTQHLTTNKLKYLVNEYARKNINKYATYRMACSKEAGRWLFGNERFEVIKNAIEIEPFVFNASTRERLRSEYKITDEELVIGHVGRFDTQKNQQFLVDVFAQYHNKNTKSKLIFIGDGWQREGLEHYVDTLGLKSEVIFTGVRADVYQYYNMMDIFSLPSLFEGLGIVLVEAQVNGLPCIASTEVPKCVSMSNNVSFINLEKSEWLNKLNNINLNRVNNNVTRIIEKGYDIREATKRLEQIYSDLYSRK